MSRPTITTLLTSSLLLACAHNPPPTNASSSEEVQRETHQVTLSEGCSATTRLDAPLAHTEAMSMSGALVDAADDAIFARTPEGLTRLQARDGSALWTTKDAFRPIALFSNHVIAQATPRPGCIDLVLLDRDSGAQRSSWSVALPESAVPTDDEREGHSFYMQHRVVGDTLEILWSYSPYRCTGIQMPFDPDENRMGFVRINLTTGEHTQDNAPPNTHVAFDRVTLYGGVDASDGNRVIFEHGGDWSERVTLVRWTKDSARLSERLIADSRDTITLSAHNGKLAIVSMPIDATHSELSAYHVDDFEEGPRLTVTVPTFGRDPLPEVVLTDGAVLWSSSATALIDTRAGEATEPMLSGASQDGASTWNHPITLPVQLLCTAP